jgi:hypothetical protein
MGTECMGNTGKSVRQVAAGLVHKMGSARVSSFPATSMY